MTLEYLNQILTWGSRGFVGAVYEADLSGKANNVTDLLIVALICMPTCYASILNLSSRVGNVISTVLSLHHQSSVQLRMIIAWETQCFTGLEYVSYIDYAQN